MTVVRFPAEAVKVFILFATACTPASGPTHPLVQWLPGALSSDRSVKLTTHLLLLLILRMREAICPLAHYVFMTVTISFRSTYLSTATTLRFSLSSSYTCLTLS
jgi:hypothetical protein